jgi:hypothetical protein|tara:strand:+ start:172 stop:372 length:201 start_codon:yes stop_codon:yes gene_type:complete
VSDRGNDKQWQDNSDGWVKAMTKSKEKKERKLKNFDYCAHDDFEWCEVCKYDSIGAPYETNDMENI